jgi:hypothetical protein
LRANTDDAADQRMGEAFAVGGRKLQVFHTQEDGTARQDGH